MSARWSRNIPFLLLCSALMTSCAHEAPRTPSSAPAAEAIRPTAPDTAIMALCQDPVDSHSPALGVSEADDAQNRALWAACAWLNWAKAEYIRHLSESGSIRPISPMSS